MYSPEYIREYIEKKELKLVLLNTYSQLLHPDCDIRDCEITQLKKDIRFATKLGASYVRKHHVQCL